MAEDSSPDPSYRASSVTIFDGDDSNDALLPESEVDSTRQAQLESFEAFNASLRELGADPVRRKAVVDSFLDGWPDRGQPA